MYRKNRSMRIVTLALTLCSAALVMPAYAVQKIDKDWQFKVFLDGDEIGFHNFSLTHKDSQKEIQSQASFDVKFLFFNAYSYRHQNTEYWQGECLHRIDAKTDDNGDLYGVSGSSDKETFIVSTRENDQPEKLNKYTSCIKTFAYWDPEFLKEGSLLNSQTGEMIDVESEYIGEEIMQHGGQEIIAKRYRLNGEDLQIDLWYSEEQHWLALESLTESGHVIRYSLH